MLILAYQTAARPQEEYHQFMKSTETLRKPMPEAKYLNVENTDRYRFAIRLFSLNYKS